MVSKRARGRRFTESVGTLVIGATIGTLAALLFAPASGKALRRRIGLRFHALQRRATYWRDAAAKRLTYARAWVTGQNSHNGRRALRRRTSRRPAVQHA